VKGNSYLPEEEHVAIAGRSHQKERTRAAIVTAARELIDTGAEVTMPDIAAAARVSEATAYRYFPDLMSLLREVVAPMDIDEAMAPVAGSADPVERIGHAAEVLARRVVQRQGAIRALLSITIVRPRPIVRPGNRFPLIERALEPWSRTATAEQIEHLTRDLAVVVSAEAVFTLIDMCALTPDAAIASLTRTARTITAAATQQSGT
jgi:AcrR family transcriptional regulator